MNVYDMEKYIEIIKTHYPNIHLQTINMISFQNNICNKRIDIGE